MFYKFKMSFTGTKDVVNASVYYIIPVIMVCFEGVILYKLEWLHPRAICKVT